MDCIWYFQMNVFNNFFQFKQAAQCDMGLLHERHTDGIDVARLQNSVYFRDVLSVL